MHGRTLGSKAPIEFVDTGLGMLRSHGLFSEKQVATLPCQHQPIPELQQILYGL